MPLIQWIMQNLSTGRTLLECELSIFARCQVSKPTILECISTIFAHCEVILPAPTILECESTLFATATVLPGPKSGVPLYPREWNLTGVYAILPNDYRKHKFIEINFKFDGDTYNESRYTENGVVVGIKDVLFEESNEEVKPVIKIENISFKINNRTNLRIQLENVQKEKKRKKKSPSIVLVGIK